LIPSLLRDDAVGRRAASVIEIDRNLLNFRVKFGTSISGSRGGEEVEDEIHLEEIGGWFR
jgi:hypothetical protein